MVEVDTEIRACERTNEQCGQKCPDTGRGGDSDSLRYRQKEIHAYGLSSMKDMGGAGASPVCQIEGLHEGGGPAGR